MAYTYQHPHPAVTTDIAIFTIRQEALKVLLVKRALPPHQGEWALPGGFINLDDSGANLLVQVDLTGAGDGASFTTVATLLGIGNAALVIDNIVVD